jgi:hypothetical protein
VLFNPFGPVIQTVHSSVGMNVLYMYLKPLLRHFLRRLITRFICSFISADTSVLPDTLMYLLDRNHVRGKINYHYFLALSGTWHRGDVIVPHGYLNTAFASL